MAAKMLASATAALVVIATMALPAQAETLITAEEAKLPAAAALTQRGITRGPTIKMVNPAETKSPFDLQLRFEAHGGSKIEPASVRVVYLRSPVVDITDRVKPFINAEGVSMAKAEVPPGDHAIRVEVKDTDGHAGSAIFTLSVK